MEGDLAKELYGESLQVSRSDSVSVSASGGVDEHDFENDDGSVWGGSDEELNRAYDLEREWQRRREQFHTIGYREGIIAGKETAAQEGFNIGFKQSVLAGYNLGIVRGVSSALAFLPDGLREKLIKEQEMRNKFQELRESVFALSTEDAFKLFYDAIKEKNEERSKEANHSPETAGLEEQSSSSSSHLESYSSELQSLVNRTPAIEVKITTDKQLVL